MDSRVRDYYATGDIEVFMDSKDVKQQFSMVRQHVGNFQQMRVFDAREKMATALPFIDREITDRITDMIVQRIVQKNFQKRNSRVLSGAGMTNAYREKLYAFIERKYCLTESDLSGFMIDRWYSEFRPTNLYPSDVLTLQSVTSKFFRVLFVHLVQPGVGKVYLGNLTREKDGFFMSDTICLGPSNR